MIVFHKDQIKINILKEYNFDSFQEFLQVMQDKLPSERFNNYTQIIKNDEVVGFKLDDNDFQFLFDQFGGWFDQDGKYFNSDAIQTYPPEESSDQDNQHEQKQVKQQRKQQGKISSQFLSMKFSQDANQRVQVIRNLNQIVQNYPQGEQIIIFVSLQPSQTEEDLVLSQFFSNMLNQKIEVKNGEIIGVFTQVQANKIIDLQGSKLQNLKDKPTLYIDIQLFNAVKISTLMRKQDLQKKLNQFSYQKNKDYANIEQQEYQKGKFQCFLQINSNIEDQLSDIIEYQFQK